MRTALIRRISITSFDGVNRFIALNNIEEKKLTRWFKEALQCDLERNKLKLPC